jgi:hypothetical protein
LSETVVPAARRAWHRFRSTHPGFSKNHRYAYVDFETTRFSSVFIQVATNCLAAGVDPEYFVAWAVPELLRCNRSVMPYQLNNAFLLKTYVKIHTMLANEGQHIWDNCETRLDRLVSNKKYIGKSKIDIVADPMVCFPAWFRVFYPQDVEPLICGEYGESACGDLAESESYRHTAKEKRPKIYKRVMRAIGAEHLLGLEA